MPPKPFKPPRPSATPSTSAKKGRPKGSTNKPKPDRTSESTHKSKSKSTDGVKKSGARKEKERERLSAASIRSLLPSLSPDTDEMEDVQSEREEQEEEEGESDDPFAPPPPFTSTSLSKRKSDQREQQQRVEEEDAHIADLDERTEKIGDELLGVILSRFYKKDEEGRGMRMSRDAVKAVGKYMDTFVREGVARAAWTGEERGAAGVLEVEDLERLAPQLLLDF